jgi:hypothetical protein
VQVVLRQLEWVEGLEYTQVALVVCLLLVNKLLEDRTQMARTGTN